MGVNGEGMTDDVHVEGSCPSSGIVDDKVVQVHQQVMLDEMVVVDNKVVMDGMEDDVGEHEDVDYYDFHEMEHHLHYYFHLHYLNVEDEMMTHHHERMGVMYYGMMNGAYVD